MALKEFIQRCLDQNYRSLVRSIDGLSAEQMTWHPDPESNSTGFLVWHYARVLNRWIQTRIRGVPQLWEGGWAEKFARAPADPNDAGFGFDPEQMHALMIPEASLLMSYAEVAKDNAMAYLEGVDDATLESTKIANPYGGELTIATVFQQLIWELNQHGGQVAYLRGMQRGLEDARYTGGVLN